MRKMLVFLLIIGMVFSYYIDFGDVNIKAVKYDPYPAETGKNLNLWIMVENFGGGDIENLTCFLNTSYPFYLLPSENATKHIGRVVAHNEVLLQYRLYVDERALEDWYTMDIRCKVSDWAVWKIQKFKIYVKSEKPDLILNSVLLSPTDIYPGDEVDVKFSLANVGNKEAKNTYVDIVLPEGFKLKSGYMRIPLGNINDQTSSEFVIDVDDDVSPGKYPLVFHVFYFEDEKEYNKTFVFNVTVNPLPDFQIVDYNYSQAYPGGNVVLHIRIKNMGKEKAEDVSLKIYKQSEIPFELSKKYDYLGDLDLNESGEGVFKLSVDEDAIPKSYPLKLEIRYVLNDEVRTKNFQIVLSVSKKQSGNSYLMYLPYLIIALGVSGGLVYYVRASRKK